jgi:hypothetical protein
MPVCRILGSVVALVEDLRDNTHHHNILKIQPSSISIHVGVTCGEPSSMSVDTKAKFLPSKSLDTGSVIWLVL